jgi:type IV pilus assembly protein PilX
MAAMTLQAPERQRGVSLIFALLTVAALSLAAVALIRAVDTGSTILGNLSFKQDTLLGADEATRRATQWLWANRADVALHNDIATKGYSASLIDALDPTGTTSAATRVLVNWADKPCSGTYARCLTPSDDTVTLTSGVSAQYVVLRLCSAAGDPALGTIQCSQPLSASNTGSSERGEISAQNPSHLGGAALAQYYRIVVRAQGVRKTVSTTETLVHF